MRIKNRNDIMAERFLGLAFTGLAVFAISLYVLANGQADGFRPAAGLVTAFLGR